MMVNLSGANDLITEEEKWINYQEREKAKTQINEVSGEGRSLALILCVGFDGFWSYQLFVSFVNWRAERMGIRKKKQKTNKTSESVWLEYKENDATRILSNQQIPPSRYHQSLSLSTPPGTSERQQQQQQQDSKKGNSLENMFLVTVRYVCDRLRQMDDVVYQPLVLFLPPSTLDTTTNNNILIKHTKRKK